MTWYKFSKVGTDIYFQISDYDRSSDGYVTTAFTSEDDGHDVERMYYGAFRAVASNDLAHNPTYDYYPDYYRTKLKSLSGTDSNMYINGSTVMVSPMNSPAAAMQYAKNKGKNYNIESFSKYCYLYGLMMLICKGRDIENNLGHRYFNYSYTSTSVGNTSPATPTGVLNTNGLFYGVDKYRGHDPGYWNYSVKCFGIENLWDNANAYPRMFNGISMLTSDSGVGHLKIKHKSVAPYNFTSECTGYDTIEFKNIHIPTSSCKNYFTDVEVLSPGEIFPSTAQEDENIGFKNVIAYVYQYYGDKKYRDIAPLKTLNQEPFSFILNPYLKPTSDYTTPIEGGCRLVAA